MIVAVCVDDRNGMLFNGRRQSQDCVQRQDLLTWCAGRCLWMNSDSAVMFSGENVRVDDSFLEKAQDGDVCFVEDCSLADAEEWVEGVLLYRWNRSYPADLWLELDVSMYCLMEQTELSGNSHDTITREFYKRV